MLSGHLSPELIQFFILYGVTGATAFIAAVYLLLRRGNAFTTDVNPPVRLRRWAASFFAVSAFAHAWWHLFYILSGQPQSADELMHSAWYVAIDVLDCVTLLTTLAGTLLSMLQDRRRRIKPVIVAMAPFVAIGVAFAVWPGEWLMQVGVVYLIVICVAFMLYMVRAVRQYGRWLRDNFADLERKEVGLSLVVAFASLLLFTVYGFIDSGIGPFIFLHLLELVFFAFLVWRVETLPQLDIPPQTEQAPVVTSCVNISAVEKLLAERCVAQRLYLQQDLTLVQLAKALDTNRTYLSQYFASKGTTYNAYINDLRIHHFVTLCREVFSAGQSLTAQQLALESGYRSYSTFATAFKQRMGQSVASWMSNLEMEK